MVRFDTNIIDFHGCVDKIAGRASMIRAFKSKLGKTGRDAEDPKDLAVRKAHLKEAIAAVEDGQLDVGWKTDRGKYPRFLQFIKKIQYVRHLKDEGVDSICCLFNSFI